MPSQPLDSGAIVRVQTWDLGEPPPERTSELVGVSWPRTTGETAEGTVAILCVGPAEWFVLAPSMKATELRAFREAFGGTSFRATDVSCAFSHMQLEGKQCLALLSEGCSLDLRLDSFPVARCARTRFAGLPLLISRRAPESFQCLVARSYQEYLLAWLADAAA
jgi:sarcosine oxidase, subunit gamma